MSSASGVALLAARGVRFKDYLGRVYPGFINLSSNYSGLDQSGLITWEGTAEIAWVPSNPSEIDPRVNRQPWCFGRDVDLEIQDDSGSFKHPKCLPKMFIYKAFYNSKTERLKLELRCILGLLKDRSIDDFKENFEEENDIKEDEDEDIILSCGNPEDEDFNQAEYDKQQDEKESKYWWEQWQKEGTERNQNIISEIMRRLRISLSGSVSGEIRLPWTPSGSLIGVCGDLAFKSLTPSYIYSDDKGTANIERIDFSIPRSKIYQIGVHEADYEAVDNGLQPISELIVLGRVKELEEDEEPITTDAEGNPESCELIQEYGPPATVNSGGGELWWDILIAETTICETIFKSKKIITTTRRERYGLQFPDSPLPGVDPMMWSDPSYQKIVTQKFDLCTGMLKSEITQEYEAWGKVFGQWYSNHINYFVTVDSFGIDFVPGGIYPFADYAQYDNTLILSKTTTKTYEYDGKRKLRRIETIVEEPISKALTTHHLPVPGYAITASSTEIWKTWGNNHQSHILIERDCFERFNQQALKNREEWLQQQALDQGMIYTFDQQTYVRTGPNSADLTNENFPMSLIGYEERLALISKRTVNDHSREGLANAPATEHLPTGSKDSQTNKAASEKWKDKVIEYRKKWEDANCSKYLSPREIVDLGEVADENIVDRIGSILYKLRQAQTILHELTVGLTDDYINGSFKPVFRTDVKECFNDFSYLSHGLGLEFSINENIVMHELMYRGKTSISSFTIQSNAVSNYTITSIPQASQGQLLLNGNPVVQGQAIASSEIQNLTFTPTSTFTGAQFEFTATDTQGNTSATPIINAIAPTSGVTTAYPQPSTQGDYTNIHQSVSTVEQNAIANSTPVSIVVPSNPTFYDFPTVLEPEAITEENVLKETLRRLFMNAEQRLSLEITDRTKLYR